MKWQRMPTAFGPHWFTRSLCDRDLATFTRVSRVEFGDGRVEFRQDYDDTPIRPDAGWWLPIPDHRMTAAVEA